ncbi:chromosome partitioning protein ParB [Caulobacter flavus]|uniref:Chromosome partitioning protein ParB n=1 Tax=Caulobacter flavus TaxID=1679497 RepID=A0A2N5CQA3_9CAUL|nr:ParB/RepB/Spo0J family partition protein [Caulobacter flavus]AYV46269.1 chromosome partitioning protein ParB [Caulobacter flavus]PLR09989.1 chromosome partitioning protein ParB [Caulobacter flavus]
MSASSQAAKETAQDVVAAKFFIITDGGAVRSGEERVYPLSKLKASPDNVRKGGHKPAVIEARAASILAKGIIQPPVVRPERGEDGSETGYALVTAGEGRRLALRLLAKRKLIPRGALVRCLVDETNDAVEISLDENIGREPLAPADEFGAFKDLSERQGWGAEAIGARFGVTAAVVRERLRLSAVAPALIKAYREEQLTLDQLMAFAATEDHARQLQVFETHRDAHPSSIRRAMTETTVMADDRRVHFIGLEAYLAAGGVVVRDLFADDRGGYLSNVALVDRLVDEKLSAIVDEVAAEGWKWCEKHLQYPHGHGLTRVWPKAPEFTAERATQREALRAEYGDLSETWGGVEDLPAEVEARLTAIEEDLARDAREAYAPDDLARAGALVVLSYDGVVRIDRGFVRPEDVILTPKEEDDEDGEDRAAPAAEEEADGPANAPLSAKLIAELTAHRTAGLRLALANDPDLALVCLTHALALTTFQHAPWASCLDIKASSAFLPDHGEGVKTSPAYEALESRYDQWARQMPEKDDEVWAFVVGLDTDSRASLLAFCVARTLDAVRSFSGRRAGLSHAETLATATALDMTAFWKPTAERYLSRVTKGHVLAAVAEGVSADTAQRLSGLKKGDLVTAAEPDLVRVSWLPPLLRTKAPVRESQDEADDQAEVAAVETAVASDPPAQNGEVASPDDHPVQADSLAAE